MQHRERERERESVCVCVLDGQGGRVFASTAVVLVVVWTAMYLTSYMDCLTGFD